MVFMCVFNAWQLDDSTENNVLSVEIIHTDGVASALTLW